MDAQNLTGIFPDAKQKKQANESSPFDHKQRCFYQMFDFKKLVIQRYTLLLHISINQITDEIKYSCEKLQALPEQKEKMFLNGLYTDGYTCRVLFARKVLPSSPEYNICLELNDFTNEEVDKHFRLCTVDPGRWDPFVSYHEQQKRKQRLGVGKIETDIPSPKTVSVEQFVLYITYMLQHMNTLLNFYGFETSKIKWLNYLSSQKAIQESVNILINGGKKYNKSRRKKTKENKKRRRKTRKPRTAQEERALTTIPKSKKYTLFFIIIIISGNSSKMPLVVFGIISSSKVSVMAYLTKYINN
ncbi:uncharacterized protein BX663DRAFT_505200 [Cokeromyces recurvatus]|uniref:uncharacterized protein n=1 Tax=Cokeromyces recurvatus TaxID=90255 RepID=UPI0022200AA7|nr:uncharacterized protein BX663DRAFT_505200 [Cokeromyces recurvatus]KAI7903781.1 hypothetical protein BX663DRAFT_505200 [Cokeromyces recurvatus]